jgi:hypothetical protein
MRRLKIIGLVLFLVLASAPAWGQLSAEQVYQVAQRVKRDPTAVVSSNYVIVDRLEDDSTLMPPPVTEGPFAVAYFMGIANADSIPHWAIYDEQGHTERAQAWQGGLRPLQRDGRNWLVVDYFKGFGGQVEWKEPQVAVVGSAVWWHNARRTPWRSSRHSEPCLALCTLLRDNLSAGCWYLTYWRISHA